MAIANSGSMEYILNLPLDRKGSSQCEMLLPCGKLYMKEHRVELLRAIAQWGSIRFLPLYRAGAKT